MAVSLFGVILAIVALLLVLAVFIALCVLQVHLSRKKSPGPGLILPVVSGALTLFVLLPVLGLTLFTVDASVEDHSIPTVPPPAARGDIPAEKWEELAPYDEYVPQAAEAERSVGVRFIVLFVPLLFVPALTFTVIYIVCRVSVRKKPPADPWASPMELKKMNIQDL